jgi:hypothetical protein
MAEYKAGAAYFGYVFGCGFALGVVRVTTLVPRFGETTAVAIELPVMIYASDYVCRKLIRRYNVDSRGKSRAIMGGVGLALLLSAEVVLGISMGKSFRDVLDHWSSTPGLLGLAGQFLYGVWPIMV